MVSAASQHFNLIANGSQSARLLQQVSDKESALSTNGDEEHLHVVSDVVQRTDFYAV